MKNNTLKNISIPKENAENIMSKLSAEAEKLPSISKKHNALPIKASINPRSSKSVSFPTYVWEQIRSEAFASKIPMNVYILHALKKYGVKVEEDDLIDARTLR